METIIQAQHAVNTPLQEPKNGSDEDGTYEAVIVGLAIAEHMLRIGQHVGLEVIQPKERESQKDNSGHRPDDDAAIVLI